MQSFICGFETVSMRSNLQKQYCRMKCYQPTLPFLSTWKWVLFPCTCIFETWVTPFPAPPPGQPQHRFWHRLSYGPDHWEHTDHRLLLGVPGKQRPLQEFLHPLCRGLWDLLGRLEAWNTRGSGHECLWVAHCNEVWLLSHVVCLSCITFNKC